MFFIHHHMIKQKERLYLSFPFGRESQIAFKG